VNILFTTKKNACKGVEILKVTGKIKDDILVLYLEGELDHHSADATREAIDNIMSRRKLKKVIFDLSELTFMDSSGISVFYGRYKNIMSLNGRAILVGINDKVRRFAEVAGLYRIFEVYQGEEEAIRAMEKGVPVSR